MHYTRETIEAILERSAQELRPINPLIRYEIESVPTGMSYPVTGQREHRHTAVFHYADRVMTYGPGPQREDVWTRRA